MGKPSQNQAIDIIGLFELAGRGPQRAFNDGEYPFPHNKSPSLWKENGQNGISDQSAPQASGVGYGGLAKLTGPP